MKMTDEEFNNMIKEVDHETKGIFIHTLLGISWRQYRNRYLVPLNLTPREWEGLKFEGRIPWGAKHPDIFNSRESNDTP